MSVRPGQELLQYRIVEKIGEGGMGEVWKAVDASLDRDVAIKILPEAFAVDAERLARFEREARVLASLNHPHIAGIYGIHEAGGVRFLAMEMVAGEDLSTVIARGPLPTGRALAIAREIAEALEAAHEIGVIHRDLKPANVRLTAEGRAKVLDFGLAKAYDPSAASDPARSATLTSAGTVAGLILGTAAYMSPEQASGQPTDRRADIWSFGVVLYEMLAGRRLFEGETVSHTLADVLRAPIDLDALPAGVPAGIRRLIERCLTRDRMRRLRDIGEARVAIEDAIANPAADDARDAVVAGASARSAGRLPWIVAAAAVAIAAVAIVGSLAGSGGEAAAPEPVRRFALEVPNSGNTRQGDGRAVAISSDGRVVVTRGTVGSSDMLYMRKIDEFEARVIEGTANGLHPEFSPDDRAIVFVNATGLSRIQVAGGPATSLIPFAATPEGIDWAEDGKIYYSNQGELWRVGEDGGEPERLLANDLKESRGYSHPFVLPGGDALLCCSRTAPGAPGQLFVFDLASRSLKSLDMPGSGPRYLPTGHVLFAQSDRLLVAPFDLGRLEITGTPEPVLERAWVDQGTLQLDVSADGTVVYLPNARGESQSLVSVDLEGKVEPLVTESMDLTGLNDPRYSPDGRRLVVSVDTGAIWMIDLDTATSTLMSESGFYPQWSPDGTEIAYGSTRNKTFDVFRRPVDLSRPEEMILDLDNNLRTAEWTRQGPMIIREEIPGKGMDLLYWPDPGDPSSLVPLMDGPDDELAATTSPDGKWLAYVSNYSGADEVYVTSFPETGARLKISNQGGNSPTWAPDGRALYYVEGLAMIRASIETSPRFRVLRREKLFEGNYVQYRWSRQYDLRPDGKRFVLIQNPARGNVEVVTRWFDELTAPRR